MGSSASGGDTDRLLGNPRNLHRDQRREHEKT
jgi:hypothetical protein